MIEYPTLSSLWRERRKKEERETDREGREGRRGGGKEIERERERERIIIETKSVGMPHSDGVLCACLHDGSNNISKLHFQWV